jgi:hypothetical protein
MLKKKKYILCGIILSIVCLSVANKAGWSQQQNLSLRQLQSLKGEYLQLCIQREQSWKNERAQQQNLSLRQLQSLKDEYLQLCIQGEQAWINERAQQQNLLQQQQQRLKDEYLQHCIQDEQAINERAQQQKLSLQQLQCLKNDYFQDRILYEQNWINQRMQQRNEDGIINGIKMTFEGIRNNIPDLTIFCLWGLILNRHFRSYPALWKNLAFGGGFLGSVLYTKILCEWKKYSYVPIIGGSIVFAFSQLYPFA